MKVVNQPIMKKDAMALVTGKPVFTNDKAPKECLIVKLLRSPYANAMIKSINTQFAMKVPGIEAIYTWEDVPQERFTMAGQTYPELSPYDRQILDQHVRYVGDPVAIVAGENEKCVDQAIKMLRVEYEVLPANLDPRKAMDKDTPLVHPEDNWKALCNIGADNKKNLCATEETHEEQIKDDEGRKKLADEVTGQMNFGSNMRGSAAYREQLSKVLLRRGFEQLEERREK